MLVLIGVLVMVRLGLWQMSRWHTEQRNVQRIEEGIDAEPVSLDELLAGSGDPETVAEVDESLEYRRVTATGTWDTGSEVLIRNRSNDGRPGGWLVTPLVEPDGDAVAVLRGWIPLEAVNAGRPYEGTAPPAGATTVTGVVQLTPPGWWPGTCGSGNREARQSGQGRPGPLRPPVGDATRPGLVDDAGLRTPAGDRGA
ncbi:MAG: SURF1 family protein [Microthrixaceae bacterium]|nr:SURF1 family protein [Microthrixaceae bacterium]